MYETQQLEDYLNVINDDNFSDDFQMTLDSPTG